MFRLGLNLQTQNYETRQRGPLEYGIDESGNSPLGKYEADPQYAVHTAAKRMMYAQIFEAFYQWGEEKIDIGAGSDLPYLLSDVPAACLALTKRKDFDITIFNHPDVSKLHFVFENTVFICEDREWGRNTKLLHRAEESCPQGLIDNFSQSVALFSVVVKRLYPEIFEFAPFQEWLHMYEPAFERMLELDARPYLEA